MRTIVLGMAILAAALVAPGAVAAGAPVGGWSPAGGLSTVRPGPVLGVPLTDGRVLIAGASSSDYTALGNVDVYDPAHGWSLGPKLDGDPYGAIAAPLPDGGALLAGGTPWFGGFDGPGPDPVAKTITYNPASSSWQAAPDMGRRRNSAAAAALSDGRVLVTGGYDRHVIQLPNPDQKPFCCLQVDVIPLATTEIFDARTRTWAPAGDLSQPRFGESAITLKNGGVLVVGGQDQAQSSAPTYLTSAEIFDESTGKWTSAGDIGKPRSGYTLTPLDDGRALLAGGLAADGVTVLRSTLIYDPAKNIWVGGPDMQEARTEHAAAALTDGRVLVSGGLDRLGRLASAETFDPAASTWIETGALETARSDSAAVSLKDGRVLVAGGRGSLGGLADSETFAPQAAGHTAPQRTVSGRGSWVAQPSMPAPSFAQDTHLLKDGRVLVLPGGGYPNFVADIYDPKTGAWSTAFSRPTNQQLITAVVTADEKVLLLRLDSEGLNPATAEIVDPLTGASRAAASPGNFGSARLDLLPDGRVWLTSASAGDKRSYFYDPVADRWSPGPDVPQDLFIGNVTWIPANRILVSGILQAMTLDLTSGAWSRVDGFPSTHWSSYSATRLPNDDVLFAGGTEDQEQPDSRVLQVPSPRLMRWDHNTGSLVRERDMRTPLSFESAVVLEDRSVLVAGGVVGADSSGDPVAAAEIYDPIGDRWSAAASMPEARSQMAAVLLRDGRVVELGGSGLFNPAETLVYTPGSAAIATAVATPASVTRVAAVSRPAQTMALFASLAIFIAMASGGLIIWSVRRRRRSARRS